MDMNIGDAIDRNRIAATERLIRPYIRRTSVVEVDGADFGLGALRLSCKLELIQHAGSFKTRGAFANLLMRDVPRPVSSRPPAAITGRRSPTRR
jgi:threonine dehydratase